MSEKPASILIVAGEASGDAHAAALVRQVRLVAPGMSFFGAGGPGMESEGVRIEIPASRLAHMGLVEVLRHLPDIIRAQFQLRRRLRETRPALVVLVDLPDFNLRLAAYAKRLGLKVLYYVSPQVWAWRKGRVRTIARKINALMTLFPFEAALYKDTGLDVRFVGHPLLDQADAAEWRLLPEHERRGIVALLPGSRRGEIEAMLPVMMETAALLHRANPRLRFLLSIAPGSDPGQFEKILARNPAWASLPVERVVGGSRMALRRAEFSIVTSGTSTLEAGILAAPHVIVYKVHPLTWVLARRIIKVEYIGLVNWVLGAKVAPEILQGEAEPERLAAFVRDHLDHPEKSAALHRALMPVRDRLGGPGASRRAAAVVLEMAGGRP